MQFIHDFHPTSNTDQGVQHVCASCCTNTWICARPTTDRDLVSVIPDEQSEKGKEQKGKFVTVVIFRGHKV